MRSAVTKADDPNVAAGARALHTRVNYVYGLLAAGLLDGYRTPQGQWRIRRASLDEYLKRKAAKQAARANSDAEALEAAESRAAS